MSLMENLKTADDLDELIHSDHLMAHREEGNHLFTAGVVMAAAIALHNLPEGMVIGASFASRGLSARAVRVGRSCASTPGSRWGFTPRKMQPQEEAMVSASAQWAPSSAASASALAIVRLLRKMSVGDTVLTSARASAPPMLPVPINPYVMVCTSFPFFPIIIHPPPERNRKKAAYRADSARLFAGGLRRQSDGVLDVAAEVLARIFPQCFRAFCRMCVSSEDLA